MCEAHAEQRGARTEPAVQSKRLPTPQASTKAQTTRSLRQHVPGPRGGERDRLGGPGEDFSLEETLGLSSEGNMSPRCRERKERVCPAEETAGPKARRWDPGFTEGRAWMWN